MRRLGGPAPTTRRSAWVPSASAPTSSARTSRWSSRARCALGRATARDTAHRRAQHEHPTDARDRLAADQATFVEQPRVLPVELLEGVVREHRRVALARDRQHERVAAADRTGRRRHELTGEHGCFVGWTLGLRDAMSEGCVDDHSDLGVGELTQERAHSFVELLETWKGSSFRRDVRSVDDDARVNHVERSVNHLSATRQGDRSRTMARDRVCATRSSGPTPTLDDVPELVDDVTDLLQHLIRNACVNDGNVASGHEARSVDTLRGVSRPWWSRLRDLRARAGSEEPRRAHRGNRPDGTDAPPHGAHRRGAGERGPLASRPASAAS